MKLEFTSHSYYCNDSNYSMNGAYAEFETWNDFKESWLDKDLSIDHDYNHCFRFDIVPQFDFENDTEYEDRFSLKLYMMLQRKGHFVPITIKEITEKDMPEIEQYLKECWAYMKFQWKPISFE